MRRPHLGQPGDYARSRYSLLDSLGPPPAYLQPLLALRDQEVNSQRRLFCSPGSQLVDLRRGLVAIGSAKVQPFFELSSFWEFYFLKLLLQMLVNVSS